MFFVMLAVYCIDIFLFRSDITVLGDAFFARFISFVIILLYLLAAKESVKSLGISKKTQKIFGGVLYGTFFALVPFAIVTLCEVIYYASTDATALSFRFETSNMAYLSPEKSITPVAGVMIYIFTCFFGTAFKELLYEDGRISGIRTTEGEELRSRLVVDASGIAAVVRRSIKDPFMENFETGPRDKFYVLLKYVKLKDPNITIVDSTSWPYYKGWIAPQHTPGGAIIGVGANLSFDYARKCMAKFEAAIPLPEYELQYEEMACTPYRRPPFSFVTDGFLVIGDAACLTKPINGEGIPSAWKQCTPAAEIVANALKDGGYPTKEKLWEINRIYQTGEGAAYAGERAMLIGAVNMTPKDNDYLYKKGIVFKSDDEPEVENLLGALVKGVISGEFTLKALISLATSTWKGEALKKHYQSYPATPSGYTAWQKRALKLWKQAGSMADTVKDA
jgi:hypothetical protein